MRAIVINETGGPEVLQWGEVPKPEVGPRDVLVKVACAAVNPADWKTREGMLSRYITYKFPFVLGFDFAGVVEAAGPEADIAPGTRVFGMARQGQGLNGSYAEYTLADMALVQPVPDNVSMEEAAGLTTAGVTAYGGLIHVGELQAGQTVLIHGGAGGVGSIGIQIARAVGARVATTCSPRNSDYVKNLGAERVIDYHSQDIVEAVREWAPEGVDLVLDAVGQNTLLPRCTDVVKKGGIYVEIETLITQATQEETDAAASKGVRLLHNMIAAMRMPEQLAGLAELLGQGKIHAPEIEVLPLGEAADAQRRVQDGHVRGKIVLRVDDRIPSRN